MQKLLLVFVFAALILASSMPRVLAEQATNIIGTIERSEGDKFVIKSENVPLAVRLAEAADEKTPEQKKIVTN